MVSATWIFILAVYVFVLNWDKTSTTEIQFDRIEILNSSFYKGLYNVSELRITKFNRTSYVVNFDADIFIDIDHQSIAIEATFHHNRLNNNQYNKMPFALKKDPLCKYLEKFYKSTMMHQLRNVSNLPQLGPEDPICPLPKGRFWIKGLMVDGNRLPVVLPDGHWKMEAIIYFYDITLFGNVYFKSITSIFGLI